MELSSVACWFGSIKIDYSGYPKSLISRIMKLMLLFFNKISLLLYSDILLKKTT